MKNEGVMGWRGSGYILILKGIDGYAYQKSHMQGKVFLRHWREAPVAVVSKYMYVYQKPHTFVFAERT